MVSVIDDEASDVDETMDKAGKAGTTTVFRSSKMDSSFASMTRDNRDISAKLGIP